MAQSISRGFDVTFGFLIKKSPLGDFPCLKLKLLYNACRRYAISIYVNGVELYALA